MGPETRERVLQTGMSWCRGNMPFDFLDSTGCASNVSGPATRASARRKPAERGLVSDELSQHDFVFDSETCQKRNSAFSLGSTPQLSNASRGVLQGADRECSSFNY